jgi:hypothetical protein
MIASLRPYEETLRAGPFNAARSAGGWATITSAPSLPTLRPGAACPVIGLMGVGASEAGFGGRGRAAPTLRNTRSVKLTSPMCATPSPR